MFIAVLNHRQRYLILYRMQPEGEYKGTPLLGSLTTKLQTNENLDKGKFRFIQIQINLTPISSRVRKSRCSSLRTKQFRCLGSRIQIQTLVFVSKCQYLG